MANRLSRILKFLSSKIVILILVGFILILLANATFLVKFFPQLSELTWIAGTLKSLGSALLGSGVFTAIIKSSEFTDVFEKVVEKIIWDEKYITSRGDKEKLWRVLSSSLYTEKFKGISTDLQALVTKHYFPINQRYYLESLDYTINVSNVDNNFNRHDEVLTMVLKPSDKLPFAYNGQTAIDLPLVGIPDQTINTIDEIMVNNVRLNVNNTAGTIKGTEICFPFTFTLEGSLTYNIVIRRHKVVCKQTNPDKRLFVNTFTKNVTITLMFPDTMSVSFYKMGTINDFENTKDLVNSHTKVMSWYYKDIIMPNQGCIVIFK